jgi:hypothetical protein
MPKGQRDEIGAPAGSLPTDASLPVLKPDRWMQLLTWTIAINVVCFFLHEALICGCHFHPEALAVALVAFLWGLYPFFFYRTRREHIVGYLAIGLSALWPIPEFHSNTQFLVRSIVYHLTVSAR